MVLLESNKFAVRSSQVSALAGHVGAGDDGEMLPPGNGGGIVDPAFFGDQRMADNFFVASLGSPPLPFKVFFKFSI